MEARRYRGFLVPEAQGHDAEADAEDHDEPVKRARQQPACGGAPALWALIGLLFWAIVAGVCARSGGQTARSERTGPLRPLLKEVERLLPGFGADPGGEADDSAPQEAGPRSEAFDSGHRVGPAAWPGARRSHRGTERPVALDTGTITLPPVYGLEPPEWAVATTTATQTATSTTTAAPLAGEKKHHRDGAQHGGPGRERSQASQLRQRDNLSYQEALDLLPVTMIRRVDVENPVFSPIQTRVMPAHLARFDLLFGFQDTVSPGWLYAPPQSFDDVEDPRSIFVSPLQVEAFLQQCELHLDDSHNRRMVAFGLLEVPLSAGFGQDGAARNLTRARLERYFDRIWYYSTDIDLPGVVTLPLGLTEMYMRNRTEEMLEAYRDADIAEDWKSGEVLAAWGMYTAKDGEHIVQADEPSAMGYGSAAWVAVYNQAMDIRNDAEGWLAGAESQEARVDFWAVPAERWWRDLSRYKFLLSPIGTAIQCSRLPEALLMLTVPIVKRGPYRTHDDLRELGFPIVVVDFWAEITPSSLQAWWRALSPRLRPFRERCLTNDGLWRLLVEGRC